MTAKLTIDIPPVSRFVGWPRRNFGSVCERRGIPKNTIKTGAATMCAAREELVYKGSDPEERDLLLKVVRQRVGPVVVTKTQPAEDTVRPPPARRGALLGAPPGWAISRPIPRQS